MTDNDAELAVVEKQTDALAAERLKLEDTVATIARRIGDVYQTVLAQNDQSSVQALRDIYDQTEVLREHINRAHAANAGSLSIARSFHGQRNQIAHAFEELLEAIFDVDRSNEVVAGLVRDIERDLMDEWTELGLQIDFQKTAERIATANGQQPEVAMAFLTLLEEGAWDGHPALGELFRLAQEALMQSEEAQ